MRPWLKYIPEATRKTQIVLRQGYGGTRSAFGAAGQLANLAFQDGKRVRAIEVGRPVERRSFPNCIAPVGSCTAREQQLDERDVVVERRLMQSGAVGMDRKRCVDVR